MQKNESINKEIYLDDILNLFWNHKKNIFIITIAITFVAIVYSLVLTPLYSSYVSIYPTKKQNKSNFLGNIEGIASTFGINVGNIDQNLFYIPDIVDSRFLKKAVIENKWQTRVKNNKINLIEFWEIGSKNKFNLLSIFLNYFFSSKGESLKYLEQMELAIIKLNKQISVKVEDSGLILIEILMEEPNLSADIANFISEYIKNYVSEIVSFQSSKNRIFINDRLNYSKKELTKSEKKLTDFRKKNPLALDTPDLQLERGRLLRNVEVNKQVYITLRQQHEIAKIEELKEIPVINILDKGEPAVKRFSPKRKKIVLSSFIFSIFISCIYVIFKKPKFEI